MTKSYAGRYDRMLRDAYGPFTPGSIARAIRTDNDNLGLRTCWLCLGGFAPGAGAPNACDGCGSRAARLRSLYCSIECYKAAKRSRKKQAA